VSVQTGFLLRDFRKQRGKRERRAESFVGLFPSLEEVNHYLRMQRKEGSHKRRNGVVPGFLR
jgi:hypothetical protein